MMRTLIDYRVKDIALEEKSIIEDVPMTLKGNLNVHMENVKSSMDQRDR